MYAEERACKADSREQELKKNTRKAIASKGGAAVNHGSEKLKSMLISHLNVIGHGRYSSYADFVQGEEKNLQRILNLYRKVWIGKVWKKAEIQFGKNLDSDNFSRTIKKWAKADPVFKEKLQKVCEKN